MLYLLKKLWFVVPTLLSFLLGLLMWAAQIDPKGAASNLSKWVDWIQGLFGLMTNRRVRLWVTGFVIALMCLGMFLGGMGFANWRRSSVPEEWLLPSKAVEKFLPSTLVREWQNDPDKNGPLVAQSLRDQLLTGQLIARGTPHYATAQEDTLPIVINTAQWQTLKIAGTHFSSAASSSGPAHSYDNLEIRKPHAR